MKVLIIKSTGTINALFDHCDNVTEKLEGATACMVENNLANTPDRLPVINSCTGIKNLMLNEKMQDVVLHNILKVSDNKPTSEIFALFNGERFSDFIEVGYTRRFMTYNIGPIIGFVCGVGIKISVPLEEAVPQFKSLIKFLQEIHYIGEISIGLDDSYCITGFSCQHFYGHFAMYSEMCEAGTTELIKYILGDNDSCNIHDTCCVANLVSKQPFPCMIMTTTSPRISAPKSAEKHLWRMSLGYVEPVLITTHGSYLREAQKRIQRTIDNMITYDPDIQFRTDYGMKAAFVLSKDKYEVFKTNPYYSQKAQV